MAPQRLSEIALMAALTAAGAFLKIPLPYVPVTLQVTFVLLAGIWLGPRSGALSQLVYLATGLLGFPIFARGGGPQYFFEPSFGYLLAFPLAALTAGRLARRPLTYFRCLLAAGGGLFPIYLLGFIGLYLNLRYALGREVSLSAAARLGLAPLPKDLLTAPLIALVGQRLAARLPVRTDSGT